MSDQLSSEAFSYTSESFADIQLLRYRVEGFEQLSLRQQTLIYHLSQAALAGRDILFDQNGRYNLRLRHAFEALYTRYDGNRSEAQFAAFAVYLKRLWFSSGIHHHYGCEKFRPEFTEDWLRAAFAQYGIPFDEALYPVIFDPTVMPMRCNQAAGEDLLLTSSANYYAPELTQAEAEAFYAERKAVADPRPVMMGLNSRLERDEWGLLNERVYRVGGLYDAALREIVRHLEAALPFAENDSQTQVIRELICYYQTGDLRSFDRYSILWLQDTESHVDFVNGFIETYGDPLGLKASWESIVNFKDIAATDRATRLAAAAQWFEDHSPVDDAFKKPTVRGVSAKVITAAILAGDLYPASAIGINLPNSDWVRRDFGSKSVTISNLTGAYAEAAKGSGMSAEFVIDEATRTLIEQYGQLTDDLHTDLHECLGHGSGQLRPGTDPDALRAYGSTIEEARADLFALYYLPDEKLIELGLIPHAEAYKASYYSYLQNGLLTQLVRIAPGATIEEAHMRNRALIARWVLAQAPQLAVETGAAAPCVEIVEREGKHYVLVRDYAALRVLFGRLLREIQRIKSEGDFSAAQALVEAYAVEIDPELHREILDRYAQLHLAPYKGFLNPVYEADRDAEGNITAVRLRYDEAYDAQMLRYSRDYAFLPLINS